MAARTGFLATAIVAALPLAASTQTDAVRIVVDGGPQMTRTSFTQTRTFEEFVEQGSLTLDRTIPKRPFVDAGAAVRVWKSLYAGVIASYVTDGGSGSVTARIPHPFFFNQPRIVTGQPRNITRKEIAAHVQLSWTVPVSGQIDLTLAGGPSIFQTQQVLVTTVNYTQEYPYDTAQFTGAATETVRNTVIGYNAGADATWRLASHLGVGAVFRYSYGQKDFNVTGGDAVPITTGGLHAGGGLRLIF